MYQLRLIICLLFWLIFCTVKNYPKKWAVHIIQNPQGVYRPVTCLCNLELCRILRCGSCEENLVHKKTHLTGINVLSIFYTQSSSFTNNIPIFHSSWQLCLDPDACGGLRDWKRGRFMYPHPVTWWCLATWWAKLHSFPLTNSLFLSKPLITQDWFLDNLVGAVKWDHPIWREASCPLLACPPKCPPLSMSSYI